MNLGKAYLDSGNLREAKEMFEKAYAMYSNILHRMPNPAIVQTWTNLSLACSQLGEFQNAILCGSNVLQMSQLLTQNQPNFITATVLMNLGVVYCALKDFENGKWPGPEKSIRKEIDVHAKIN